MFHNITILANISIRCWSAFNQASLNNSSVEMSSVPPRDEAKGVSVAAVDKGAM